MRNLYWGDLHNHCSVGLFHHATGSLARAIEIARAHLDFFAFTGHSQWHDMPPMVDDAHLKWQEGFDYHTAHWPKTVEMVNAANEPGRFVAFVGYEWHSGRFGDRNVIFPGDDAELRQMDDVAEVEALARQYGAMLYPHHIGYRTLDRGINWELFNAELCPLIEIVSEHGCAERDRGLWPYISHSNGPRTTRNTYRQALAMGLHCGVAGGSDDHLGFPGAYGEGVLGVWAEELTRPGLWEAFWKRRTIAATGDRVAIGFGLNDGLLGDVLDPCDARQITVAVKAWDEIDKIELIKNNRVIRRWFPHEPESSEPILPGKVLLRIEFGWGPWSAFKMPRTADWDFRMDLTGQTRILAHQPCLQCAPFDEDRRHRIEPVGPQEFHWVSYTSRTGAYRGYPNNAMVFELDGRPEDEVRLSLSAPVRMELACTLADLAESSRVEFTGDFPSESFLVHRLVPAAMYSGGFKLDDAPSGDREDSYYVRVTEANGQMAWASPIWVRQ